MCTEIPIVDRGVRQQRRHTGSHCHPARQTCGIVASDRCVQKNPDHFRQPAGRASEEAAFNYFAEA